MKLTKDSVGKTVYLVDAEEVITTKITAVHDRDTYGYADTEYYCRWLCGWHSTDLFLRKKKAQKRLLDLLDSELDSARNQLKEAEAEISRLNSRKEAVQKEME